jgi:hypothetical protein
VPYERIDPVDPSQRAMVAPVGAVLLTPLEREEQRRRREQAREERRRQQAGDEETPANDDVRPRLDLRG